MICPCRTGQDEVAFRVTNIRDFGYMRDKRLSNTNRSIFITRARLSNENGKPETEISIVNAAREYESKKETDEHRASVTSFARNRRRLVDRYIVRRETRRPN